MSIFSDVNYKELLEKLDLEDKILHNLLDKHFRESNSRSENIELCNMGSFLISLDLKAEIIKESWQPQQIFKLIQQAGEIEEKEMYRTFNMGIGMTLVIDKDDKDQILSELEELGEDACLIGEIKAGIEGSSLEIK